MSTLLPIAKKVISNQINKIKSRIMRKIRPNKIKKKERDKILQKGYLIEVTLVLATENKINTPKIVIEKSPVVAKPKVITLSKIATKPKKVSKPKQVDKPKIVIEKKP